jgi:probable HAF family extracellular repeat protein
VFSPCDAAETSLACRFSSTAQTIRTGPPNGLDPESRSLSWAIGSSDAGYVAGYSYTTGDAAQRAFAWSGAGGMADLGRLTGGTYSVALGVNNLGRVVGYSSVTGAPITRSPGPRRAA